MERLANHRVIGPNGQGPFEVQGTSSLDVVRKVLEQHPEAFRGIVHLEQPKGPHGPVVGYQRAGNALSKVGAFDLTWLGLVE